MALNFPDSPTLNQIYTDSTSGFSYQWDGVVWQSYSASATKNILVLDDISGSFDSSETIFNLTNSGTAVTPANAQQLRVTLGGIVQEPGTDYLVAASQIAFTTAPDFGIDCSIVSLGPAIPVVGIASTGTVYVRQQYSPTGVQTSFTFSSGYTPGFLDVYQNGVKLVSGDDYTASDGSTFDLTTPTQNGDDVEAVGFLISELYSFNGVLNNLVVSGNATVAGITTLGGNVKVGVGTTALIVEGDARITGILTIGTSSVTIDGVNNEIKIGTGVTISSSNIAVTGVISATSFVGDGSGLIGAGSTVADITTNATYYPLFTETTSGTVTASGVSTSKLTFNPSTGVLSSTQINDFAGNLRTLPNNAKSGSYVLAIGDVGELINITTGGVTVPADVFSVGDNVTIYNNSSSAQTITQGGSVTLRLVGTTSTGNRTLDQRGLATVLCVASNEFVISGGGLA